jgi:hypothetical protein
MSVTLSGVVYDEELANADVAVYVGTNPTPVGTGLADENGNYTLTLTVSESVSNQACVIRAVRGNFSLETLPGTVNTVAAAAQGGIVTNAALSGLNVTNVSTALLAVIRAANSNSVPNSQALIDAAEASIRGNTVTQDQVLQLAAAIKLVIDYGVALPGGSTDTADLVADILAGTTTFVADNQGAISTIQPVIQNDPILAAQLIVPPIHSTDLAGQKFMLGEDTLISFDASGGTHSGWSLDALSAGSPNSTGTWSLNETTQVLTVNWTEAPWTSTPGATGSAVLNFSGGNPNVIPVSSLVVDGVSQGPQTLTRVLPVPTPFTPFRAFNTEASMMLAIDDCTGATTNNNLMGALAGSITFDCSVDSATGGMVLTPTGLLVNDGAGGVLSVTSPFTMPIGIFTLTGTDSNAVRYARWEQELSTTTATLTGNLITSYGKARVVSADTKIIPDSATLRIDAVTADTSIAIINSAGTQTDVYKWVSATATTNLSTQAIDNTAVIDPVSGYKPTVSTSGTGSVSYVFGLPGGTFALDGSGQVTATDSTGATVPVKSVSYSGIAPDNSTSAVVKTRVQYALQPITVADVSGKTFKATDLVSGNTVVTVKFDPVVAGATGGNGSNLENGNTWTWDTASGQLMVTTPWSDPDGSSGTDENVLRKGLIDMGTGSILVGGYAYVQGDPTAPFDVWAWVLTEQ